jgi:hypothetical protein
MSAPDDDDDHEIGDHGTVVMPRKGAFPTATKPAPLPLPPPPPPHAATMNPQLTGGRLPMPSAHGSAPLPTLPPAVTGLPAAATPGKPAKNDARLAPFVAVAAFGIVFVLGALIMLGIRLARGPADETPSSPPAPSASAAALPANARPASPAMTATGSAAEPEVKVIKPLDPVPQETTPSSRTAPGRPSSGTRTPSKGGRSISTDL